MANNKYITKTCEDCTAEFDISILNEEELNNSDIKFCPCCGRKTEQSIVEEDDDADWNDWDDQDHNGF